MKVNDFQVSSQLHGGGELASTPARLSQLTCTVKLRVGARRSAAQSPSSQDKVQRVVQEVATLLDEGGAEAVTTTAVAARAEVSIGWLYTYFADRQSLLEEAMIGGLDDLDGRWEKAGFSLAGPRWREQVKDAIKIVVDFVDASPGIRSLWFSADVSGRMLQAKREHDDALAEYLAASVTAIRPDAPNVSLGVVTQMFIGILDMGLDLAYRNDPRGDEDMLTEMSRACVDYLDRFLA